MKSNTKRRARLVQAIENRAGKVIRISIRNRSTWPEKKRMARWPNLNKLGINGTHDPVCVQNFGKRTRVGMDKKSPDNKSRRLRIRSRRAVWMDGPTLRAFMFGDGDEESPPMG